MTDILIIEKAIEEIEIKSFGTTKQFLKIHEVVYIDNRPKVLRVDREKNDGTAIVYFPIKDENFYLAIYLDTVPKTSVRFVGTEPYHSVYFNATTKDLDLKQLSSLTKLKPTTSWSKGDKRKSSNLIYKFSALTFEPNPEADEFEDKLKKLLTFLEQDKEGILTLVDKANGYIQVATSFHNGNTMLGGHHIHKELIKRMSHLNLEIDFDNYANGNSFKD